MVNVIREPQQPSQSVGALNACSCSTPGAHITQQTGVQDPPGLSPLTRRHAEIFLEIFLVVLSPAHIEAAPAVSDV